MGCYHDRVITLQCQRFTTPAWTRTLFHSLSCRMWQNIFQAVISMCCHHNDVVFSGTLMTCPLNIFGNRTRSWTRVITSTCEYPSPHYVHCHSFCSRSLMILPTMKWVLVWFMCYFVIADFWHHSNILCCKVLPIGIKIIYSLIEQLQEYINTVITIIGNVNESRSLGTNS